MEDEEETGKEEKEGEVMEEEEEEEEEEEMETQGGEGDVESSLLDPGPGEEDEEDEEEVEDTREKELIKEEVSQDDVKEVRDHSDPLYENQKPTFSELALNSRKDTIMSDDDDTKVNEKCQAKTTDLPVTKSNPRSNNNGTKSNPGSTKGHQAESITTALASDTAKVYKQEKEEVEIGSETGEKNEEEATGGGEGELEITGEVMGRGRRERKKDRKQASAKKSGTPGAGQMADGEEEKT